MSEQEDDFTRQAGIFNIIQISDNPLARQLLIQPDWEFIDKNDIQEHLNPLVSTVHNCIKDFSSKHRQLVGKIRIETRIKEFTSKLVYNALITLKSKKLSTIAILSEKGVTGSTLVALTRFLQPWYTSQNLSADKLPLVLTFSFIPFEFKVTPFDPQERQERLLDTTLNRNILPVQQEFLQSEEEDDQFVPYKGYWGKKKKSQFKPTLIVPPFDYVDKATEDTGEEADSETDSSWEKLQPPTPKKRERRRAGNKQQETPHQTTPLAE